MFTDQPRYRAYSYSTALVATLAAYHAGVVFSQHEHACNLLLASDQLIALVSPQHGDGPFHIVVPPLVLPCLRPALPVEIIEGQLICPAVTVMLDSAQHWESQVKWPVSLGSALFLLHEIDGLLNQNAHSVQVEGAAWLAWAESAIRKLRTGLHRRDLQQMGMAASRLIGLGPGLTPVGDDLLVGLLAGLHWQSASGSSAFPLAEFCALLQSLLPERTTRLSAQWLQHATQNEFGAPWHGLAAALTEAAQPRLHQALRRIAQIGATSGKAALLGFATALA